jgi:hypothetical protein
MAFTPSCWRNGRSLAQPAESARGSENTRLDKCIPLVEHNIPIKFIGSGNPLLLTKVPSKRNAKQFILYPPRSSWTYLVVGKQCL